MYYDTGMQQTTWVFWINFPALNGNYRYFTVTIVINNKLERELSRREQFEIWKEEKRKRYHLMYLMTLTSLVY